MQQAKEASEIFEQLGDTAKQAHCLITLARLLLSDDQLDAAEAAAFHAIDLVPEEGYQSLVCESRRALGNISRSKDDTEKAIRHFEAALGIASPFDRHDLLFWIHYELAGLFRDAGSTTHTLTSNAPSRTRSIAHTTWVMRWSRKLGFGTIKADVKALCAADIYEKLGAVKDAEHCRTLLRDINEGLDTPVPSGRYELLKCCYFLRVLIFHSNTQGTGR